MNAEEHARFAAAQGMRIIKVGPHLWAEKQKLCLESIPPHRHIQLEPHEARELFRRGFLVLRYTCDEAAGTQSAEYICDVPDYGFDSLEAKTRNQVRQGLRNCKVRPVQFELLRREGCAINQSVFQRQGRQGPVFLREQSSWDRYMDYCAAAKDIEPYGAFVDDKLCAYVLMVRLEDYAYVYHPFAKASHLQFRPMNALIFTVTQHFLQVEKVLRVSYGLESLASQPALEKFKSGMGYRSVPIGRKILLNPLARPLVSDHVANLISVVNKSLRGIEFLESYLAFVDGYRRCTT